MLLDEAADNIVFRFFWQFESSNVTFNSINYLKFKLVAGKTFVLR